MSGYLNVEKHSNKNSRIVELIFIMFFWSCLITFIFYNFNLFNYHSLGIKNMIIDMFSFKSENYWYVTSYILLFFMIPYINMFINKISKRNYKKLLIILFVLFCIIQNFFIHTDIFKINYGYSPFWLIYLYMIGGYIKKYEYTKSTKKSLLLFLSLLLGIIFNYIVRLFGQIILGDIVLEDYFIDYISPFTLFSSILILLIFKNINIAGKTISRILIFLSKMSFSVYIIHCNKLVFSYVLINVFAFIPKINVIFGILIIIASLIVIYIVCSFLDILRKLLFKTLKIDKLIEYIGFKLDLLLN